MRIKTMNDIDPAHIYIHHRTLRSLEMSEGDPILVHFGCLIVKKYLVVSDEIRRNWIGLSCHFTDEIHLPEDILYEIKVEQDEIFIGPVIGLMIANTKNKLTRNQLELLSERVIDYEQIGGLIFASTKDLIDFERKIIKGYYYTENGDWKEGVFPYPNAMWNRTFFHKRILRKLTKGTGMTVFNNCKMTKAKLWKLLGEDKAVNDYLPFTKVLVDVETFYEMTEMFSTVYLKPSNLSRGRGIIRATKKGKSYLFKDAKNHEVTCSTENEIREYLTEIMMKHKYIIQQAVPYFYNNRLVDFRLYLQKDETKEWNCSGIYCRVSKPNSIVTNLRHSQQLYAHLDALEEIFELSDREIDDLEEEMVLASKEICSVLEDNGQIIGDVALDIVIDETLKVWVLEVQVNYAVDERLYLLPSSIYQKVWTTPIKYAKAVSGFD